MTQRYDDGNRHHNHDQTGEQDSQNHEQQQNKHILEQLLIEGHVPVKHADFSARILGTYPSKQDWLVFFDKTLLILGSVSLTFALVFFIAYNWINMGTLSKFALVESALVMSVVSYAVLAYKEKYAFAQQLLLLIASIITGGLLALFGQVYQTGADTWQLFASWALFITPWVLIARMPALWLMWLGLINISFAQFFDVFGWFSPVYAISEFIYLGILFVFNVTAFNLWLVCTSKTNLTKTNLSMPGSQAYTNNIRRSFTDNSATDRLKLNWSTYVVGLIATYYATSLGAFHTVETGRSWISLLALMMWLGFYGFIYWRFRKKQIDLLMLTALCGSLIIVIMFWVFEYLIDDLSTFGFLILTLTLVSTSSAAVSWLNKLRKLDHTTSFKPADSNSTALPQNTRGNDNER